MIAPNRRGNDAFRHTNVIHFMASEHFLESNQIKFIGPKGHNIDHKQDPYSILQNHNYFVISSDSMMTQSLSTQNPIIAIDTTNM